MRNVSWVILILLVLHCAGSRHTVSLNDMQYAVSMSPQIYGSDGKIKANGAGVDIIGDIEVTRRYWSLVYSFVPIGDTKKQVADFNQVIATRGAHGVVNFEIENEGCDMNNFAYVIAPAVLPFFPGCSKITFRGKLVRESGR
ncbi:hypothetical protein [Turneriella parva]|uniref:Uncharacterized protein n=1 Tax=Turneriella parva (strain ATCC BAA-1111 / DSM 21527 / NCTC 11395 / H) TaxID=869212 RepID=I4B156_TURPD|nr:hypothetical protein [Turneriella parva]AFM11013.1 hypothetical protein Turpa_0357 [Turneriella parva DSM 21527]